MSERTTCEVLTGPGRAAIAVIRLAGPESRAILSECFRAASDRPIRPGQVRYGQWTDASQSDDAIGESVVLVPLAEDQYEVHCHGGIAAVDRIREDMTRHGAVEPLDDLGCADHWLIAEAEAVLVECTAKQPARVAMEQVRGALSAWRDQAVQQLKENPDNMHTVSRSASEILESAAIGTRLSIPFDVVLAGRPNVGKSSLINAMVGYDRSIATDLAGTTRDVLDAETVLAGWPVRLRDTAGLHLSDQEIEREGIERAKHAIQDADLVILVRQPDEETNRYDEQLVSQTLDETPVIQVLNKADLCTTVSNADLQTVATKGEGIEELCKAIIRALTAKLPVSGRPVPVSERQASWLRQIASSHQVDEQLAFLTSVPSSS